MSKLKPVNELMITKPRIFLPFLFCFLFASVVVSFESFDSEEVQIATSACSTKSVSSTTFIKSHHLFDLTDGFGVLPTKDGGYVLTGDILPATGMAPPYPFIVKTDAKGGLSWARKFSSQSNALGDMSSRHVGRLVVETTDGYIVTAIDVIDFVDENKKEIYGDVLVTKINTKGTQVWSLMLGDYSIDRPQKIWALPGGGVMLLARFMKTGYGDDVADTDVVPKYSVLIKIDKNGKVQSSKKVAWDAVDMQWLADGGFIALANITVPKTEQLENILGPEVVMGDLPTIIKLDSNLNVLWAKSLEMIPSVISTPTSYAGGIIIGKTTIRFAGGDFRAIESTPDGGFLAVGFDNLGLTHGLSGGLSNVTSFTTHPFTAVKVDAAGNYKWAKKLTVDMVSGISSNDFQMIKTADNDFVIMQDVIRDSDGVEAKSSDASQKQKIFSDKCEELKVDCPDSVNVPTEVKSFADAANAAMAVLLDALATNVELIKIDADANPRWVKKIDAERDFSGYGLAPTADKGVVVSGSMLTTKRHMVFLTMEPYKEATLVKVDANGKVDGCAAVSDHSGATLEDQSSYLVMQNMGANVTSAENLTLKINKKVKGKIATTKDTTRDICKYKKSNITPDCSYLTPSVPVSTPSGQSSTPVAKTWAEINYDNATEDALDGTKATEIHEELMPILKQIFNNKVKMTDSLAGMWLDYVFPRLVTRQDVLVVEEYYKGLGYKIDESEGGDLYVSKIGRSLHLDFSITSQLAGKLEVTF